jgi:hypothetical protein
LGFSDDVEAPQVTFFKSTEREGDDVGNTATQRFSAYGVPALCRRRGRPSACARGHAPHSDRRVALLAYSALDRLHTCCGAQQPWIVLPTAILDKLQQDNPFELLLLDVMIPEDERHGGGA